MWFSKKKGVSTDLVPCNTCYCMVYQRGSYTTTFMYFTNGRCTSSSKEYYCKVHKQPYDFVINGKFYKKQNINNLGLSFILIEVTRQGKEFVPPENIEQLNRRLDQLEIIVREMVK